MQASYTAQQQKGLVYTAPRVGDYAALRGYNSQKGYAGVGQSTILQGYNTKRTGNYGESGYLFSKTPEVMGAVGGESFTTRRLNDLVGEEVVEKSSFTLPEMKREKPIQRSYEVGMVYKPQRRGEQRKYEGNVDMRERGRGADEIESSWVKGNTGIDSRNIDSKKLAELIEQELRQFQAEHQQVQHV